MYDPLKEITYILHGNPIAWARAHPGRKMWDTQKQLKLVMGLDLLKQHNGRPFYEGPLHLEAHFYFPMPKSQHKKFDLLRGTPHYFKPDLSNLIKLIEDCAKGVLYHDDCLIASENIHKRYADVPRTEFKIREIR